MSQIVPLTQFSIRDADVTDSYAILVGYYVHPYVNDYALYKALLLAFNLIRQVFDVDINYGFHLISSKALHYNFDTALSVSINPTRHMAIIGMPDANKLIRLNINTISSNYDEWTLNIIHTPLYPHVSIAGIGRSVVWLDNATVAISVLIVPDRPWSKSEVWVYDIDKMSNGPLFAFPNNQQIILFGLPRFLHMVSWFGNLLILIDPDVVLFVPSTLAGFLSVWNSFPSDLIIIFNLAQCVAGTYKNVSNFGPCTVCPPQTKNSGKQPCTQCEPCASNSFCPLGSVDDVSLDVYPSYTQTFSYPSSPDMNNYDDLLVQNIFTIGRSQRCIVISPLFWAIIIIILCFIIWFLMTLPKICNYHKGHSRRKRIKQIFKKIDIINEGERWVSGLFSFSIIALFSFTLWFASEFLNLYPIETYSKSYFTCDDSVRNIVFESALQLPLPNPDGKQWTIFKMLDDQPFTMTVDLLNTAADCSNIAVYHIKLGEIDFELPIKPCIVQPDNATRSISFALPTQRTTIQINIKGPFFIGGMRLCLHGPGHIRDVNTLQTLDMCQLFSTTNSTLSFKTTVHMVMIKVINVTKPLNVGGNTHYHGRWAPTFAESSLSDELHYGQYGQRVRYRFQSTIITITLSEQPFYLQNIQQPIIRKAELTFHTLLFCTLIIELFSIASLIFKLVFMPAIHFYRHRTKKNYNRKKAPSRPFTIIAPVIQQGSDVDSTDTNM